MDYAEGIVGLLEAGAVPVLWYFWKRIQKKKKMLIDKDKELQSKTDEIQDLKSQINLKDLEIKMIAKK